MTDVKKLDVPQSLRALGDSFREAGHELYLVGGYVRDALTGSLGLDADATTGAVPREIKKLLRPHAEHLWTVGERFGTIGASIDGFAVEVTTYRTDLYTEGSRHPEIRFGDSLEEDLARRDFTINAIAADTVTGDILDPFEGRKDLEAGVIRPVGEPLDRMRDDPLRMLRAVRFEARLSSPEKPFAITPDLEQAIQENAAWLESISSERIRDEFDKILTSENVSQGLRTLVRLGLMRYIAPEFLETLAVEQEAEFHHKDVFEHTLIVIDNVPNTYCGAKSTKKVAEEGECERCGGRTLAKKIHFYGHENIGAHIARKAMKRLTYPRDDIDATAHLVTHHMRPMSYAIGRDPWTDAAVRRFVRDTYLERGDRVLADVDTLLKLAKDRVDDVRARDNVERVTSPLTGDELMEHFGRGPGRWIKHLKDYLEAEVIEGRLQKDDIETAWKMAEQFAHDQNLFKER
jgi:poly(A) polymerase